MESFNLLITEKKHLRFFSHEILFDIPFKLGLNETNEKASLKVL